MMQPELLSRSKGSEVPLELQLEILRHLVERLDADGYGMPMARAWTVLNPCLLVCRAWRKETCRVVARLRSMPQVVYRGPTDSFVHDVLTPFLDSKPRREEVFKCAKEAAERDFPRSLQMLLNAGANPCTQAEESDLFNSAMGHHSITTYSCLKLLVDGNYIAVARVPLQRALDNGNIDIIQWLLEHGANPNGDGEKTASPLFQACVMGRGDLIELLVIHGARLSAAHFRYLSGTPEHADKVFKNDPTAPQRGLAFALERHNDYGSFIKVCLQWGADPNAKVDEMPLLSIAAQRQSTGVCEMLLNAGANPNPAVDPRKLPLYCAASSGYSNDMVAVLRASGASSPPSQLEDH